MPRPPSLEDLRRHAIARSLGRPASLPATLRRLGFVQADPIRAPARAQDLILRHRVTDYRAGDLEQRYPRLAVEEDYFVNYGFLGPQWRALMHPRTARRSWPATEWDKARAVLDFVRERGVVHPREVDAHFAHGKTRNWFGGTSNASTQLLDGMHYRGLLRVARREGGIRLYAPQPAFEPHPATEAAQDQLLDLAVQVYAPLPAATLGQLASHIGLGAPQWRADRARMLRRAQARLAQAVVDGQTWYWPAGEQPQSRRHQVAPVVRLLAPFDPIVWDRRRFEQFWGWAYRFEAYTPAAKRVRGYYALPLLWGEAVIGWANAQVRDGQLVLDCGYVSGQAPRSAAFRAALADETAALARFLGLEDVA